MATVKAILTLSQSVASYRFMPVPLLQDATDSGVALKIIQLYEPEVH